MTNRHQRPGQSRPRKRFGQNFLTDTDLARRIVAAMGVRPGDRVLEIGPGRGALTEHLLAECDDLSALEVDRDLAAELTERWPSLGLIVGDALRFDYSVQPPEQPWRIIGNLPYNISTPLLMRLVVQPQSIVDMHFMLQREVVDRLCATPGSSDWGRLSVMAQYYCDAQHLLDVGPESFYPQPKVNSAVVCLTLREVEAPPEGFAVLVRTAFSGRRKTLNNALRACVPQEAYAALDIDGKRRPDTLSVAEFVAIAEFAAAAAREA